MVSIIIAFNLLILIVSPNCGASIEAQNKPLSTDSANVVDPEAPSASGDHVAPVAKRDIKSTVTHDDQLDTQETGFLPPPAYHNTDSDYGYDSGKNSYGKQASDWSLYDQGE